VFYGCRIEHMFEFIFTSAGVLFLLDVYGLDLIQNVEDKCKKHCKVMFRQTHNIQTSLNH